MFDTRIAGAVHTWASPQMGQSTHDDHNENEIDCVPHLPDSSDSPDSQNPSDL